LNVLPPDAPAESVDGASRSEARVTRGAAATLRVPPPNAAPPLKPTPPPESTEVEPASIALPLQPIADGEVAQPIGAAAAPVDIQPGSAQTLPKPRTSRVRRRSSDVVDEMRLFGFCGSCAPAPSKRRSKIRNSASQELDDSEAATERSAPPTPRNLTERPEQSPVAAASEPFAPTERSALPTPRSPTQPTTPTPRSPSQPTTQQSPVAAVSEPIAALSMRIRSFSRQFFAPDLLIDDERADDFESSHSVGVGEGGGSIDGPPGVDRAGAGSTQFV